jgi:predicted membrane channel-forming protein YqfA (hemolysin III family)
MSGIELLTLWGIFAGVIAGIVLHRRLRGVTRQQMIGAFVAVGVVAILFLGGVVAAEATGRIVRRAWTFATLGAPALVAGVTIYVLGRIWKVPTRRKRTSRKPAQPPKH